MVVHKMVVECAWCTHLGLSVSVESTTVGGALYEFQSNRRELCFVEKSERNVAVCAVAMFAYWGRATYRWLVLCAQDIVLHTIVQNHKTSQKWHRPVLQFAHLPLYYTLIILSPDHISPPSLCSLMALMVPLGGEVLQKRAHYDQKKKNSARLAAPITTTLCPDVKVERLSH